MTNNTPSGKKSITKVLNQKVARWPKCFSFFLHLLQWVSSKLHVLFTMVFTQNSSILHWAVHQLAHHFFTTLKSYKVVQTGQWELWLHFQCPFLHFQCLFFIFNALFFTYTLKFKVNLCPTCIGGAQINLAPWTLAKICNNYLFLLGAAKKSHYITQLCDFNNRAMPTHHVQHRNVPDCIWWWS